MTRPTGPGEGQVSISDEGIPEDPKLPWLAAALGPAEIEATLLPIVARVLGWKGPTRLIEARMTRHKPGRRSVFYYQLEMGERIGVYGKMRARGADLDTQNLLEELRGAGLARASGGRASVPRPLGCLPQWNMTLQEEAPGKLLSLALDESEAQRSVAQVAEALFRLHSSGVNSHRVHGVADELEILQTRLDNAAERAPAWRDRITAIGQSCSLIAAQLPPVRALGIHRDFYPDQVIIEGDETTLLDLDLFALGDPALDVGNFTAHLTEMALRDHGHPQHFKALEDAFEERYEALAPGVPRRSMRIYRLLTLARHIHLSMTLPGRSETTATILDVCEAEIVELDE